MSSGQTEAEIYRDIVAFAAGHDIVKLLAIGKIALVGVAEVEKIGKFAQKSRLSYSTRFLMPDGQNWRLELRPCDSEGNVQ